MMRKKSGIIWKERFKYARFRTWLIVFFIMLSIIPLVILGGAFFGVSKSALIEQAESHFIQNAQKTSTILDKDLDYIEEFSVKMNADPRIYEIFSGLDGKDPVQLKGASDLVGQILLSYLPWNNTVYSTHLLTSYYRFGEENKNFYPPGSFMNSEAAKLAQEAGGKLVWIPTYSYTKMFQVDRMNEEYLEYGNLFSAVRKLHPSNISSGRILHLPDGIEEPYLVVNFTEENLRKMLEEYLEEEHPAEYFVATSEGGIVCSAERKWNEKYRDNPLADLKFESDTGIIRKLLHGEKHIIAYSKSQVTGWYVVAAMPVSALIEKIVGNLLQVMIVMVLVITVLSFLASFFISKKFNSKIYKPLNMIESVGAGNFETVVRYHLRDEFAFFYSKLNEMNHNLKNLVHENYEVKLQKRESEIMVLNIQLNPHFLYNSLNIINWLCLDGKTEKASGMLLDLSRMLQYTSKNDALLVPLRGDLDWLARYLAIMSKRYAELFTVKVLIPKEFDGLEIPKLFLQPFVENAIVHAFKSYQEDGVLEISVEQEGGDIIFCIEDNGCGITQERIREIMNQKTDSIGILNTDKRLRMIYGPDYGVSIHSQIGEGTTILIRVPDNRVLKKPES